MPVLPPVTFVLGGARSGKSAFAERLATDSGLTPVYVATGRAFDGEMAARIADHRSRRGSDWQTVEAPLDRAGTLAGERRAGCVVLVDCLTLWLTNLMLEERDVGGDPVRSRHPAQVAGGLTSRYVPVASSANG